MGKFIHDTVATGTEQVQTFIASRLRNHVDFWKTITSDSVITSQIMGSKIELNNEIVQADAKDPYTYLPEKHFSKMSVLDLKCKLITCSCKLQ